MSANLIPASSEITADIAAVKYFLSAEGNPNNDEAMYNIAAYHAQQAIEKALKFYLREIFGEDENDRALKVHDIATLAGWLQLEYNADIPSEIIDRAEEITDWEANSRYGHSLVTTRESILSLVPLMEAVRDNVREIEEKISNGISVSGSDIYVGEQDNSDLHNLYGTESL